METDGGYFVKDYRSRNNTVADAAWDSIETGVGLVAVEKDWATAQGLPIGWLWPLDRSKAVFAVAAYHPLHCVVSLSTLVSH